MSQRTFCCAFCGVPVVGTSVYICRRFHTILFRNDSAKPVDPWHYAHCVCDPCRLAYGLFGSLLRDRPCVDVDFDEAALAAGVLRRVELTT